MKPIATGGILSSLKRCIVMPMLLLLSYTLPAQQQVKKGRWFIGHSIGGPAYEVTEYKTYNNSGVLTAHTKFSGLFFNLSFMGPNWGGLSGNSYEQENIMTGEKVDSRSLSITLQPTAGVFVRDNFMIGASFYFIAGGGRSDYSTDEAKSNNTQFGVGLGPLLRYYLGNRTKSKPFVGLQSRFSLISFKQESSSVAAATTYRSERDQDNKTIMLIPQLGYAWFPGKRWILELRLDYRYEQAKVDAVESSFTNNVLNTGYPRRSNNKQAVHSIGVIAGVAVTLN